MMIFMDNIYIPAMILISVMFGVVMGFVITDWMNVNRINELEAKIKEEKKE